MVPNIESDRLLLEKVGLKHLSKDYLSWMNDPEVYRFLESGGDYSYEELKGYLEGAESNETLHFWAIIRKDTNRHIGNVKIDPISKKHNRAEYGILMGDRDSWGMGFAKEATSLVLDYCFDKLNLRKVTLGVVVDNTAAVKLYERLGFIIEGHYKEHGFYIDKYCDAYRMAIFQRDWDSGSI